MKLREMLTTDSLSGNEIPKPLGSVIRRPLKDKKKRKKSKQLEEGLQYIKFSYNGKNATIKRPRVKLLDPYYPGRPGQKTYGLREDLLGWSLSHVLNRRAASRAIDEITDFARILSADSQEAYKRIKYFYPEQSKFIRRYIRDHISNLKQKDGMLWKKISLNELDKYTGD